MTIADFRNNYRMYDNMSIWEIKSIDDSFKAHENMQEIFEKEYKDPTQRYRKRKGQFQRAFINDCIKIVRPF